MNNFIACYEKGLNQNLTFCLWASHKSWFLLISSQSNASGSKAKKDNSVSCGKTANSTIYDHLKGIQNRHRHPHIAEPEVASLFHKGPENTQLDLAELEKKLMKTRREVCWHFFFFLIFFSHNIANIVKLQNSGQPFLQCFFCNTFF